ncbi:hypothetical protein Y032_0003g1383 [Ancylostoma ceylanicum]|uniref:Uncharacterized protein n=1 Tax=Ancylostoma ceylanicum TaxID=53326 RepID=A0A016VXF9_9BILA|nr:hypothetical protein Y032_0003g1383 [Ancylostoma ceylanicum]
MRNTIKSWNSSSILTELLHSILRLASSLFFQTKLSFLSLKETISLSKPLGKNPGFYFVIWNIRKGQLMVSWK